MKKLLSTLDSPLGFLILLFATLFSVGATAIYYEAVKVKEREDWCSSKGGELIITRQQRLCISKTSVIPYEP